MFGLVIIVLQNASNKAAAIVLSKPLLAVKLVYVYFYVASFAIPAPPPNVTFLLRKWNYFNKANVTVCFLITVLIGTIGSADILIFDEPFWDQDIFFSFLF